MSGIHVMDSGQGAAWRFQLSAMVNVLRPLAREAETKGDQPVIEMLAALEMAHAEAVKIEDRDQSSPLYRGVSLAKS